MYFIDETILPSEQEYMAKYFRKPENYPELHIAYYQVDPVEGERYKKLSTGEYIYIYSLTFANGLADKEYEWREVFNRIYP